MKENLTKILNTALIQILEEIKAQDVRIITNPQKDLKCEVIITIGITGNITGTMMLKSDQKSAIAIAQHMLNTINHDSGEEGFTEHHQEAIREVMNFISGRSLMILSEQNIDCNLTPPTLITGKQISPSMYDIAYTVHTGAQGDFGEIYLFFGVKNENIPET